VSEHARIVPGIAEQLPEHIFDLGVGRGPFASLAPTGSAAKPFARRLNIVAFPLP
jgi:hypothetical protein